MVTVEQAWEVYNSNLLSLKNKKTQAVEHGRWVNHIKSVVGDRKIDELTLSDYFNLRQRLENKKLSPQTVYHCLSLLRRILNRAVDFDLSKVKTPSFFLAFPVFDNKRLRFLSKLEVNMLVQALECDEWRDIVLFAINTGMRKGEIENLKKGHCDFQGSFIHIVDTKSKKNRVIPMNETVKGILSKRMDSSGEYCFVIRRRKVWENAIKHCGFNKNVTDPRQKVVFHTLRHTFASWLALQNTPMAVIKELLGHCTIDLTLRYAHLSKSQLRIAVDKLSCQIAV